MTRRIGFAFLACTTAFAIARPVAACGRECGASGYDANATGNTVEICSRSGVTCPAPGGMVRQDATSGDLVRIPDACASWWSSVDGGASPYDTFTASGSASDSGSDANNEAGVQSTAYTPCYVDRCVPPGTYRYGFGRLLTCSELGCEGPLDNYVTVEIMSPLPASCTAGSGAGSPTPLSGPPPWGADNSPAQNCPAMACSASPREPLTAPLGDGLLVLASLAFLRWHERRRGRASSTRVASARPSHRSG